MSDVQEGAYAFGTIFVLANRLQILGDQVDPKLSVKQWLFLAGITRSDSEAPALSELAARIGSSRQNVKKMAILLESRGFITMSRDEADARVLRLALTDYCKQYLKQREQAEIGFLENLFEGFEPQELADLSRTLRKLDGNAVQALRGVEAGE